MIQLIGLITTAILPGPLTAYLDYKISLRIGRALVFKTGKRTFSIFVAILADILLFVPIYGLVSRTSSFVLQTIGYDIGLDQLLALMFANSIGVLFSFLCALYGLGFLVYKLRQVQTAGSGEGKLKSTLFAIVLLVLLLLLPGLLWNATLWASNYRPFAERLVMFDLKYSCGPDKQGCHELRPLPAYLQGKKIVVDESSYVEFEPYEQRYREIADLDIIGFLGVADKEWPGTDFVDPIAQRNGYLGNKEYTPIRAVYSYNCSGCFDSDDSAYIVVEDENKNRFIIHLQDYDFDSKKYLSWDEQTLLLIGKGWRLVPAN